MNGPDENINLIQKTNEEKKIEIVEIINSQLDNPAA